MGYAIQLEFDEPITSYEELVIKEFFEGRGFYYRSPYIFEILAKDTEKSNPVTCILTFQELVYQESWIAVDLSAAHLIDILDDFDLLPLLRSNTELPIL